MNPATPVAAPAPKAAFPVASGRPRGTMAGVAPNDVGQGQRPVASGSLSPRGADAPAMRAPLHLVVAVVHHRLGVAVIAAWRDLLAPDPRVERVVGPLDF